MSPTKEEKKVDELEVLRQEIIRINQDLINCKDNVTTALEEGTDRMDTLTCQVKDIATTVHNMDTKVSLLFDILDAAKGFFKVVGWFGKVVKWVAAFGVAFYAIKLFLTTGHWK